MIVHGRDTSQLLQPLLVDATGKPLVVVSSLPSLPAGSNNIGDVDVLTLPSIPAGPNKIGSVDVVAILNSLPAGLNTIGGVNVISLPSLPAGSNKIGKIEVDQFNVSLPAGSNTIGTVYNQNKGYDGSSWKNDNLRMGYGGVVEVNNSSASPGGTFQLQDTQNVSAGQIWRLQHLTAVDQTTKCSAILLAYRSYSAGVTMPIVHAQPWGANDYICWTGDLYLKQGDYVLAIFYGSVAGDNCILRGRYIRNYI